MIHGRRALNLGLSGVTGIAGSLAAHADVPVYAVRLQSGLNKPLFVAAPPGDNDHLFMLEQGTGGNARVRILNLATNTFAANPFITITGLATGNAGSEQGLLGLAFDPNYATNGNVYLNYTTTGGTFGQGISKVVRYTTTNFATAASNTAQVVMQFDQPQTNHNGGWIGFGKDNYLYIATGDGGNSNDTGTGHTTNIGNAQDLTSLLGKMLRVDPSGDDFAADATKNYAIPKGGAGQPPKNPFSDNAATPNARPEIWNYGLRNPWRNSFDRKTGDLLIGDVGQGAREEVDFQPANSAGGLNFGWRIREGNTAGPGASDTPRASLDTLTSPIFDYNHGSDAGVAVTGGYVYRGTENAALNGTYFFADYGNGKIWMIKNPGTGAASATLIQNPQAGGGGTNALYIPTAGNVGRIDGISSFGEDAQGRLYITELGGNSSTGELFRLIPALPGDANGDRIVNDADLKAFLDNYNPSVAGKLWAQGDFNDDHVVDFKDFQILELNYGRSVPLGDLPVEASAVPEPTGLAGALLGAIMLRRRRRPLLPPRPVLRERVGVRAFLDGPTPA